jgi:hypothetical protein
MLFSLSGTCAEFSNVQVGIRIAISTFREFPKRGSSSLSLPRSFPDGDCCENLKWVMQENKSITYARAE